MSRELQRWYQLRPHAEQRRLWESPARFRVVPSGRRSGKSEICKRRAVSKAVGPQRYADGKYILAAPTYMQAKRIFWADIKAMVPRWALVGQNPRRAFSESELTVRLASGSEIIVAGLDKPERIEGIGIDYVCLDEYGNCKESVWGDHLRPALSERRGEADLIGVPEGRNHYYMMALKAQEQQVEHPEVWGFYSWPSADILDPSEIASAKAELDSRTFEQEYCASFLDATGRVYHAFDRDVNVEKTAYDPSLPLILCLDFNVRPGTGVICQEQRYTGDNPAVDRAKPVTVVIDEIWVKDNSNTVRVCEEFLSRYRNHAGELWIYGDAAGGARGTSQTEGSDWDVARKVLRPVFGSQQFGDEGGITMTTRDRLMFDVPKSNPSVRARINATNSRIRSVSGTVRLLVDPSARHLIEDFEGVVWDDHGDIDKKGSPMLSHESDAIGYYLHREYPICERQWIIEQI